MNNRWSTALPDWEKRLLAGQSLVPKLPLNAHEVRVAREFFGMLRIPDIYGTPTMDEACGPWFFPILEALFGSYDPKTKRRHISEVFQLIPKGNGKSSTGGAVMLTALLVNRRPEAEFLFVAPTIEVAQIAFRQARGTIMLEKFLREKLKLQEHVRRITHRETGATLQIKAADTEVITGSKATGTMIDETHEFARKHNAKDIFVELRGALAKRPDGFLWQTTTQSKSSPTGVFAEELKMARMVRDGEIEMPILPVLYELPERLAKDGGWKDRKLWPIVNPNLGRSVDQAFLEQQVTKAEITGPAAIALIASQHFNVEIGVAYRSDHWAGAEYWERAEDPTLTLEELLRRSEIVVVGIDGGGLDDLFGVCVLGKCRETQDYLCWTRAWCHRGVLQRRKSIASRLLEARDAEELIIVDKSIDDIEQIVALIREIKERNLLGAVAVDPAGIGEFVEALRAIEVTEESELLVGVPQGYAMMNAIKTAERKVENGTLKHSRNKLMDWCVGNVKIEPTATAIRATKQSAGDAKVDLWFALMDAIQVMVRNPETPVDVETLVF